VCMCVCVIHFLSLSRVVNNRRKFEITSNVSSWEVGNELGADVTFYAFIRLI
jgi:hypothetical protein